MSSKYARGVLLCVIATMSWGGMFPVMTHALRHIDPFTFTIMRDAIAGLAFAAVLAWKEGWSSFLLRGMCHPALAYLRRWRASTGRCRRSLLPTLGVWSPP